MAKSKRILIIEDEASIRRLMALALEASGYEVAQAPDGPSGLARFGPTGTGWDAVIIDQRMPGMDGLETLRRLKAANAAVPVIMVTAFGSIDLAVDAMKLGASDFVRKPLTPDTLRHALEAALLERAPDASSPAPPKRRRDVSPALPNLDAVSLNGFRIAPAPSAGRRDEQRFRVTQGLDVVGSEIAIPIQPEAIARVARAAGHRIEAWDSFWSAVTERLLAAYLWSEGGPPPSGTLKVMDVSPDDLAIAATWPKH